MIFAVKKDIMELQKEVVYRWGGRESWGLVIVLSRENWLGVSFIGSDYAGEIVGFGACNGVLVV